MSERIIESKNVTWHHISNLSDTDLEALQDRFKFHSLDYEDILTDSPISKMDTYKHYLFFVFHIPTIHIETGHVFGEPFYVFLSNDVLVTLSRTPQATIEALFDRFEKSTKFRTSVMNRGSSYLLYRILLDGFRHSMEIVKDLSNEVTRLEEAIEHKFEKKITVDLGHARRNALFLRHIIDPQRNILVTLSNTKRIFLQDEHFIYFDDLHDVLDTISLTSENLKHIIDGLFDMNETLLSHKTNEVITLLTIISAALMVPTLITGFYGMNVDWLPFAFEPRFVAALFVLGILGMIAVVTAVLKRHRM